MHGYEEVQKELALKVPSGYFRPTTIAKGHAEEIVIVDATRYVEGQLKAKWWKQPKDGGTPYLWRFTLDDGRVWDVINSNTVKVLEGLFRDGSKTPVPGIFRVTNIGHIENRQPSVKVEYLGPASESHAPVTIPTD